MAKKKKDDENSLPWTIVLVTLLTFVAGIVFMVYFGEKVFPPTVPTPTVSAPAKEREVKLYFGDGTGRTLVSEKRTLKADGTAEHLRATVEAIITGPVDTALTDTMPTGTRLLSLKISGATAVVDLSKEVAERHHGGSSGEILTVFSLVNTLALNFEEIDSVQLLVGGEKKDTLVGHILIKIPLVPNRKFISK